MRRLSLHTKHIAMSCWNAQQDTDSRERIKKDEK